MMKAKHMFILGILILLICFPAAEAADYIPAIEKLTATVADPANPETEVNYIFSDLTPFWGAMLLPSDKDITEEAVWDMHICDGTPNLIRWVDNNGNTLEIDLSVNNPLNTIVYTEADSGKMVIFDLANLTATEITATGLKEAIYDELPFFAMAMYQEVGAERAFSINLYSIDAIIDLKSGSDDSGESKTAEATYEKEDFCGIWVSTDLSYYIDITTDTLTLKKLEILDSWSNNRWKLSKERITIQDSMPYDRFEYLDIVEENGDIHLVYDNCVFVRPEEYVRIVGTYALGDTAVSESAEISVTDVEFTNLSKKLLPDNVASDQKYIKVSFTVSNNDKELFNIQEDVRFFVDYNNGFTYLTHFEPLMTVWMHPATGVSMDYYGSLGTNVGGFKLEVSPLDTEKAEVYIPVPDKIASDNESPLKIYVSIPCGEDDMGYCFVVR